MTKLQCEVYKEKFQPSTDRIIKYINDWENLRKNNVFKIIHSLGLLEQFLENNNALNAFGKCSKFAEKYLILKKIYAQNTNCSLFYKISSNNYFNILKKASNLQIVISQAVYEEAYKMVLGQLNDEELNEFQNAENDSNTNILYLKNLMGVDTISKIYGLSNNYLISIGESLLVPDEMFSKYGLINDPAWISGGKNYTKILNKTESPLINYIQKLPSQDKIDSYIVDLEDYGSTSNKIFNGNELEKHKELMGNICKYFPPFFELSGGKCKINIEKFKKSKLYIRGKMNDYVDSNEVVLPEFKLFTNSQTNSILACDETIENAVGYGYIPIKKIPTYNSKCKNQISTKILAMKPYIYDDFELHDNLKKDILVNEKIYKMLPELNKLISEIYS